MINWFRNKLHNFIFPETNDGAIATTSKRHQLVRASSRSLDTRNGMNFTIHQANGGYVLEYSTYDEKTDRHDHTLHIINSDADLGQGIAHVITLEMIRK